MRTLRNAVEQGKVHHAYLFVGSRGTGKTSMAKILAACLNCEQGPTVKPCGVLRVVRLDRERDVARRHRDGRGVEQLGRRHPRPARARRVRAGLRAPQGLHPRRGAHALVAGVERVPQDARGAAAEHDLRARHDRGAEGPADGRRPLPPLRLRAPDRRAARRRSLRRVAERGGHRDRRPTRSRCSPATRPARSATRSARSSSSSPTRARRSRSDDVLAVLGVADADLLFGASTRSPPATRARRCSPPRASRHRPRPDDASCATSRRTRATCSSSRRSARCRPSCASRRSATRASPSRPRRDRRAATSRGCSTCSPPRCEATKDGADARTQLELALVKAAAPEVDPSAQALLARIERLEAALRGRAGAGAPPAAAAAAPRRRAPVGARRAARSPGRRREPPPPARAARRRAASAAPAAPSRPRAAALRPRRRCAAVLARGPRRPCASHERACCAARARRGAARCELSQRRAGHRRLRRPAASFLRAQGRRPSSNRACVVEALQRRHRRSAPRSAYELARADVRTAPRRPTPRRRPDRRTRSSSRASWQSSTPRRSSPSPTRRRRA